MADYRIYLLHDDGRIASGVGATCEDDQDACVQAQQMLDAQPMLDGTRCNQAEVWIGTRCVGKVGVVPPSTIPS